MSSFWKYFVTSPASEQGGPVLPETLAPPPTQNTGPHAPLGEDIDRVFFQFQLTMRLEQRPPSARAYSPQMTRARRRKGVTYCGPGTGVDNLTVNIRSARASGTINTVVPSRTNLLSD
ncbi:uncharacterized protein BJ212DRAFT_1305571 [Suillus subaureus]|uniref:Uncharacterized protein n=1 Tax=Suillus subaureus TaxID=48587 RepID=A0A9P7DNF4_9AGAM|nr:uncharacterized protein BJ212DRAFT_1305571 [Suillus subaureus]KAG1799166.1 hypothetical protein BJ212DRAFT_1305571 [Suillus subaureus]